MDAKDDGEEGKMDDVAIPNSDCVKSCQNGEKDNSSKEPEEAPEPAADTAVIQNGDDDRAGDKSKEQESDKPNSPEGLGLNKSSSPKVLRSERHSSSKEMECDKPSSSSRPECNTPNCSNGPGCDTTSCSNGPGCDIPSCSNGPGCDTPSCSNGPGSDALNRSNGSGCDTSSCSNGPGYEASKESENLVSEEGPALGIAHVEAKEQSVVNGCDGEAVEPSTLVKPVSLENDSVAKSGALSPRNASGDTQANGTVTDEKDGVTSIDSEAVNSQKDKPEEIPLSVNEEAAKQEPTDGDKEPPAEDGAQKPAVEKNPSISESPVPVQEGSSEKCGGVEESTPADGALDCETVNDSVLVAEEEHREKLKDTQACSSASTAQEVHPPLEDSVNADVKVSTQSESSDSGMTEPVTKTDTREQLTSEVESKPDLQPEPVTKTDTREQLTSEVESKPDVQPEPVTKTDTREQLTSEVESKPDLQPEPVTKTDTREQLTSEVESKPDLQPEPVTKTDPREQLTSEVESKPDLQPEPVTKIDIREQLTSEVESKPDLQPEPVTKTDTREQLTSEVESKPDLQPVNLHTLAESSAPSKGFSVPASVAVSDKPSQSVPNPIRSTARKSVPGKLHKATARKTGYPQKNICNSDGKYAGNDTIKILNLHPNSNITLRLSELEKVLNRPRVKEAAKSNREHVVKKDVGVNACRTDPSLRDSTGRDLSTSDSSSTPANSVDGSSSVQTGFRIHHKRRRKRGGTYDFPGGKKHAKKKRTLLSIGGTDLKAEGSGGDACSPLKKLTNKLVASPRKQYTVMELFKNRAFHKRHTTHEALMRRRSPEHKKTVSQILTERRRSEVKVTSSMGQMVVPKMFALQTKSGVQLSGITSAKRVVSPGQEAGAESATSSVYKGGSRRMVQKLFVTKDGLVSSVNVEDASERENTQQGGTVKRKSSGGGSFVNLGSADSGGSASKKGKVSEALDAHLSLQQQQQPMVMVVAQHSQNAPGLRSILPKPRSSSTSTATAGPVMVSAGQKLLLAAPPLLVKPGTKVALVPVSGKSAFSLLSAPMVAVSKAGNAMPVTAVTSLSKVFSFCPSLSGGNSKNSDALRALLASSSPQRLKTVTVVPGSIPATAQKVSIPSSMVATLTTSRAASSSSFMSTSASSSVSTSTSSLPVLVSSCTSTTSSSSMSSSSSSSSSSSVVFSSGAQGRMTSTLPNGLLPVTPPKTPEGEAAAEGMMTAPDSDAIPLCCCKIYGTFFTKMLSGALYCQALDSVDGKVLGCCNKVSNLHLLRPGVKIPFMAVCEVHRKRMKMHQCCPGCGHFCTQGKFYQCRKEGSSVHNFHRQCQTERDGRLYCPHCGEESGQVEVTLALNDSQPAQTSEQIRANLRKSM